MKLILAFFQALPALIALVKTLQKRQKEANTAGKVADDVKVIHEAFSEKDPAKLNALFSAE